MVTPALPTSDRPWLDHDSRDRIEQASDRFDLELDVLRDRGRFIVGGVGDPKATTDVEELAPRRVGELGERLDRLHVGLELEDLRADVRVQADEVEVRGGERRLDALCGEAVGEAEPELGVELAGLHV